MKFLKTIVVIPVGPTCQVNFILDTLNSIYYYMNQTSTKVILIDDSQIETGKLISKTYSKVEVLKTPYNRGKNAGLYYSLAEGFNYAYKNYKFKVLLRLDTDALIIGKNPENKAIEYFEKNKKIGILGSYKYSYNGRLRDFSWPERQLILESSILSLLKGLYRIKGILTLRTITKQAKKNGYILGEHCMGGACFYSYNCIKSLYDNNYLPIKNIQWSKLQEDMIFGLLIKSIDIHMHDFVLGNDTLGVKWRGLPDKPSELIKKKKIIHSTRFFEDMDEKAIRDYFKSKRN